MELLHLLHLRYNFKVGRDMSWSWDGFRTYGCEFAVWWLVTCASFIHQSDAKRLGYLSFCFDFKSISIRSCKWFDFILRNP